MPARAPPSIDMLQTVMRPSIDRALMAVTAIFDDVASAAGGADLTDDGENDVLGGYPRRQRAIDGHAHILGLLLCERLGRQHVLDLAGADAVRQGPEGAMGRGVAVAANDGRPRQGKPLFGTDHVHDALTDVAFIVVFDAELLGISGHGFDLGAAFLILDPVSPIRRGRDIVIDHGQRLVRRAHLTPGEAQTFEGLRARHFVHEVTVDIENAGAIRLAGHDVVIENLVVKRLGFGLGHGKDRGFPHC